VLIAEITDHPDASWMSQVARNARLEELGYLHGCRYVLQDRDAKFCAEFRRTLAAGGVKCLRLAPRSPNLNAFPERWVRLDALELSRDAGADWRPPQCGIGYAESYMSGKDRLRLWSGVSQLMGS
jgi:hypothetical protein